MSTRHAALGVILTLGSWACSDDSEPTRPTSTCQQRCTTASVDCPISASLCVNSKCVACTKDSDCAAGLRCHTATGTCNHCESDPDCPASTFGGGCNTTTKTCAYCRQDGDCMTTGGTKVYSGKCDTTGKCYGCSTDADCAGLDYPICAGGSCSKQCRTDADCGRVFETDWCDAATGQCIGCETDTQCDQARPLDIFGKYVCQ